MTQAEQDAASAMRAHVRLRWCISCSRLERVVLWFLPTQPNEVQKMRELNSPRVRGWYDGKPMVNARRGWDSGKLYVAMHVPRHHAIYAGYHTRLYRIKS